MYFDALTLAAVADELRDQLLGGRIQRVVLPGPLSLGLEIYARGQRHQLLLSAHPQFARVQLVHGKLSRGVEQETPLLLLLRKYVRGGRIIAIEQPALERMLLLSIVKEFDSRNRNNDATDATDDMPDEPDEPDEAVWPGETLRCELIVEPMERRSNIILVDDDNLILDSIKRVTPRMSQRVVLPRRIYELPPPQEKRDPRNATANGMEALRSSGATDVAKALVAAYKAVSPQLAREVVFRALGRAKANLNEDVPWYGLAAQLRTLFSAPAAPTLVRNEAGEPLAYAPYELSHMGEAERMPGISAALETFYASREQLTAHRQRRDAVVQQLAAARERLHHQLTQIQTEAAKAGNLEQLRWEGEMIFAFLHEIQKGQTSLSVEGRSISLDPQRSPVEQAQERFRTYEKARSAQAGLPERLQQTIYRLDGLDQLRALLELANEREQIEQIALEAVEQGYLKPEQEGEKRPRRPPKLKPLHLVSSDGLDIFVGRSASQNEEVTFTIGRPDDLWLHVRTIHGAHVIVRSGAGEVPERTLQEAAGVAAYFSQAREEAAVDVDLARRHGVRKIRGGPVGLVTYRAERTLRVKPLPPWGKA